MTVSIQHGDSRELLKGLADNSIDSVVCDPPYALVSIGKRFGKDGAAPAKVRKTGAYARASAGFMGKRWDTGEVVEDPAFWAECLRVLKPGGHLVAFSGTRTQHRQTCAIEVAGFEIRDQILWAYASGFPKSHSVSKGIDKALGRERTKVKIAASDLKNPPNLVGGVNKGDDRPWRIEAAARGFHEAVSDEAVNWQGWGTALKPSIELAALCRKPLSEKTVAANVLRWGTGAINIDACRIGTEGGSAGAGAGAIVFSDGLNGKRGETVPGLGRWPANLAHDGSDEVTGAFPAEAGGGKPGKPGKPTISALGAGLGTSAVGHDDSGSAARFFFSGKAGPLDRFASRHPTVKPVALMRWLCRLVTPPGGTILDMFAGSGSTGVAAMAEGFDCILMEREAEYVADIERRMAWMKGDGPLTDQVLAERAPQESAGPLFATEQIADEMVGPYGVRR